MALTYNGRFRLPEEPKVHNAWLVAGIALIPTWPSFFTIIASVCCFVKYGKQIRERTLYRRFQEYCAVIGMRNRVPVKELKTASPSGTGMGDVRKLLQEMISRGYFGPEAYIDLGRNELVLPDARAVHEEAQRENSDDRSWPEVLSELMRSLQSKHLFQSEAQDDDFKMEKVARESVNLREHQENRKNQGAQKQAEWSDAEAPKPRKEQKSARPTYAEELERTLGELYELNREIDDKGVSQRIDRIGTLTEGIFRAVMEKPEREQDVRKFMNYYLPTTLKLLRSYNMLEEQHYQSQNIIESRKKIEDVLDTLIQAFEKQIDLLYRDDAIDIASDIDVLETMMAGDGLSSKGQLPLH